MRRYRSDTGSSTRNDIRELLGVASLIKDARWLSHVQLCLLKEIILTADAERFASLQRALGPKPWNVAELLAVIRSQIVDLGECLITHLFEEYPLEEAHIIATTDVERHKGDTTSLVYGEVDYKAFSEVLSIACQNSRHKKFYDLGSGAGRAVFTAALNVDFEELVGIELLGGLHKVSHTLKQKFDETIKPQLAINPCVSFIQGDLTAPPVDWTDGDVIFANSTCFSERLLDAIANRAETMRPGSVLITFSMALKSLWLRVVFKKRYNMSWGPATVFVHVKLDEAGYQARLREGTEYDNDQAVVYPTDKDMGGSEHGDVDSLRVHFSETSSIVDAAEDLLARLMDGLEIDQIDGAGAGSQQDVQSGIRSLEENDSPDVDVDARRKESEVLETCKSNVSEESILSPGEEALYEQSRDQQM